MAFILGLCAEQNALHKTYQANTVKNRRVLSLVFLGKRVWKTGLNKIASALQKTMEDFIAWHGGPIQNG